ncbi:MAG: hypothetical protein KDA21_15545 [Phycisphaerales bacterium]|nr:hypothetical protein [Phycisphaerales bacterium]
MTAAILILAIIASAAWLALYAITYVAARKLGPVEYCHWSSVDFDPHDPEDA